MLFCSVYFELDQSKEAKAGFGMSLVLRGRSSHRRKKFYSNEKILLSILPEQDLFWKSRLQEICSMSEEGEVMISLLSYYVLLFATIGVALAQPATATGVSAGSYHTMYVKTDGTLWAMGSNDYGQLGDGTTTPRSTPAQVTTGVASVAIGWNTTMYVKSDGSLWGMGYNRYGQLGNADTVTRYMPIQVASGVANVSIGTMHTLYVKTDGTLWSMGRNIYGELGDGTAINRSSPIQVATGVVSASAGDEHTMFIKADGTLWATGRNNYGQFGDGTTANQRSAVQVATGVASVSAGAGHTMYVKTDGTLWAMGLNDSGQLGDSTLTNRSRPVQVDSGVRSVDSGWYYTMYVKTDGSLWATGSNAYYGHLGDGTMTNRSTPVKVASAVASVSAGVTHTVYVKTDGTLWAVGSNEKGKLGDGTQINRSTVVAIAEFSPAAVTKQPSSTTAVEGSSITLSLTASGSPMPSIQWYKNGNPISSAQNTTLGFTGVLSSDAGTYTATVTNVYGGVVYRVTTLPAILSVVAASPTITTQPSSSSVTSGSAASFSAVAGGTAPITYQWRKDGTAISGATGSTYSISSTATSDAGSYTVVVTNSAGSATSNAATLTVTAAATAPSITTQPSSSSVISGSAASFSVAASGTATLTYQWRKDGTAISGATGSTYSISSTATSDAGSYTVVVTNSAGSATSNAATLTVTAAATAPRLSNLSVRTALESNQIVIVGVTMSGGSKNVLLRAVGPTLTAFGVPSVMADPKLDLYSGSTKVTTNDNWGGSTTLASAFQSVGAFAYSSTASLDAALVTSIDGGRTVQVSGSTSGTVLVEGYDAGTGDTQRFTNLSARNKVGTGANILIAGFTLTGSGTRNLLIRAVGPKLSDFGVTGVLADPKLEIYSGSTKLTENDNWASSLAATFSSVGAFGLTTGSKDAAITVSLPAGGYTVQVSGADGGVGEAIVEIYELP